MGSERKWTPLEKELYEALYRILGFVNRGASQYWKPSYADALKQADAALAKARGDAHE